MSPEDVWRSWLADPEQTKKKDDLWSLWERVVIDGLVHILWARTGYAETPCGASTLKAVVIHDEMTWVRENVNLTVQPLTCMRCIAVEESRGTKG